MWCGSITNFFAAPWSKSLYPPGASSSEMVCTFTALATSALPCRIACISCRLYFITGHCPVVNACDFAHPSPIRHPEQREPRSREWGREEGEPIGVEAAEAFRVIVIEDDAQEEAGPTHVTPPGTEGGEPAGG